MKPFNLEEAKLGKLICTRDGRSARILDTSVKGDYPIVVAIEDTPGYFGESVYLYDTDGHMQSNLHNDNNGKLPTDLMMDSPHTFTRYILLKSYDNGTLKIPMPQIFIFRGEAEKYAQMEMKCNPNITITVGKVEWEE